MKNSKVTSVQPNGTWEGKYGLNYKFEISFENGDVGEYSSKNKEQNKFIVGQQTDYEYTDGKFPKVKPVYLKPDNFNKASYNSNKEDINVNNSIARSVAFKGAIDYDSQCSIEDVIKNAKYFYDNWLSDDYTNKGKIDIIKKSFDAEVKNDDLPF